MVRRQEWFRAGVEGGRGTEGGGAGVRGSGAGGWGAPAPGRGPARARRVGASGGAATLVMCVSWYYTAKLPERRSWTWTRARTQLARSEDGWSWSTRPKNATVLSGWTTRSYLKQKTRSGSKASGSGR